MAVAAIRPSATASPLPFIWHSPAKIPHRSAMRSVTGKAS